MELDRPPSEVARQPGSILVLAPGPLDAADRLCGQLLAPADGTPVGLVIVTLVQPPATRLSVRKAATDTPPEATVVVTLDSLADASPGGLPDDVEVLTVSNPANLTRLGVTITEAIAALDGTRPVFCFHSLSVLLQYADAASVYRFLNVLRAHLDAVNATAHFHLDPSTHDDPTVEAFRQLFDQVVTAGD